MAEFFKAVSRFAFVFGCTLALIRVESSILVFAWGAFVKYLGESYE